MKSIAMKSRALNSHALVLVALFSLTAGNAMSDPAAQPDQQPPPSQSTDANKPSELTPSQLIAQDFRTLAQDHATVGAASPRKEQPEKH